MFPCRSMIERRRRLRKDLTMISEGLAASCLSTEVGLGPSTHTLIRWSRPRVLGSDVKPACMVGIRDCLTVKCNSESRDKLLT